MADISAPVSGSVGSSSSSSSPAGSVDTGTKSPSTPTPDQAPEQKVKIRVNQQEREYTMSELKNLASKGAAADERFRTASEMEKNAKELLESVKGKKLSAALEKQGYTKAQIRELLESELTPFVEEDMMSPDERERAAKDRKLAEYEAERQRELEKHMTEQQQQEMNREIQKLNVEFLDALEKTNLPRDPYLGKMVAQMMIGAEQNGYSLSVLEAAELVNSQFAENTQRLVTGMSIDKLKQFLGKDTLSKLREADVSAIKTAERPFTKQSKTAVSQDNRPTEKSKQPADAFFNKIRGIKTNKE